METFFIFLYICTESNREIKMYPLDFFTFISSISVGLLSAYLARKNQKNIYLWFFIGFILGLCGIIALFFLDRPSKTAKKNPITLPPILHGPKDKLWYYLDINHDRKGPMSLHALTTEWHQGKISSSTYVWNEELPDWKPLENFIVKNKQEQNC